MKKTLLFLIMLLTAFFTYSCSSDDTEEPTLSLSEYELSFPKTASEKTITITTNQSEWVFVANADWVKLTRSGNSLVVKVLENMTAQGREADIMVVAGVGKTIHLKQEASAVNIVPIPDRIDVDQWGGKYQFDVETNVKDWKVTTEADWLKVTKRSYKSVVELEVSENKNDANRTAKIYISDMAGKGIKEFVVKQNGVMSYILPCLQPGASMGDVKRFEENRRSYLSIDWGTFGEKEVTFKTKSRVFPAITYLFFKGSLSSVNLKAENPEDLTKPEMERALIDDGFEKEVSGDNVAYTKSVEADGKPFVIAARIEKEKARAVFVIIPRQPVPMPTFKELPYTLTGFGKNKTEDVFAYEKEHGGEYNKDESNLENEKTNFLYFDVKNTPDLVARSYYIDKVEGKPTTLSETGSYYTKQSLVFYEVFGQAYLTEEFRDLAKREGYQYLGLKGLNEDWHYFENKTKKFVMVVRWVKYKDMDMPVVDLHFFALKEKTSGGKDTPGMQKAEKKLLKCRSAKSLFN